MPKKIKKRKFKWKKVAKDWNWQKEWYASNCINKIREILHTYWDEDYKLYKIVEEIQKFLDKLKEENIE